MSNDVILLSRTRSTIYASGLHLVQMLGITYAFMARIVMILCLMLRTGSKAVNFRKMYGTCQDCAAQGIEHLLSAPGYSFTSTHAKIQPQDW